MSLFGTGRKEGVGAVLLLVALALVVHVGSLAFGLTRSTTGPAVTGAAGSAEDTASESATNETLLLPAMATAGRVLREGEWPTWNPDARFGEPFSFSGAALLYPPYWPLMLEDGVRWLDLVLGLHAALACAFAYRFLRSLPLSRYSSFLGGGAYGMGWFLTTQLDRLPEAAAAALLPFALETTWRVLVTRHRDPWGGLMAVALAALFLTGSMAVAPIAAGLCLAMVVAHLHILEASERGHALRTLAGAGVLALAITAPYWLLRAQLGGEVVTGTAATRNLQLPGLLGFLVPAGPAGIDGSGPRALAGFGAGADPLELVFYPGALVLVLLVLGVLRPKRTTAELFWVLVAGTGVLLSLAGPIASALLAWTGWGVALPGAGMMLTQIALVVLASIALENFFDSPTARAFATPMTAILWGTLLLAVAVLGFLWPQGGRELLAQLATDATAGELADALVHLRVPLLVTALLTTTLATMLCMWRRLGILRLKRLVAAVALGELLCLGLFGVPRGAPEPVPPEFADDGTRTVTADRPALPPGNLLMARGERTVNTRGNAILRRTADYLETVDPAAVRRGPRPTVAPLLFSELADHALLGTAGIRRLMAMRPFVGEAFLPVAAAPGGSAGTGMAFHGVRREPARRVRIVHDVQPAASAAEAHGLIAVRGGNLDRRAVLENPDPAFRCRRPAEPAAVRITEDGAEAVELAVTMGQGRGYLILADAWAPGWRATLDGVDVPLLRADLAFRAVAVPEGDHVVRFEYRPWAWSLGIVLTVLGLVAAAGWSLLGAVGVLRPRTYGS